jgi:alanyl aminopeptidase
MDRKRAVRLWLAGRLVAVWLAVWLVACAGAGPGPAPEAPEAAGTSPAAPDGWRRLDRSVVPRRYTLDLSVDPTASGFSGRVSIEVELSRELDVIRMHGEDLALSSAAVVQGGETLAARALPGPHGGLALLPARPLAPGPARIEIAFAGPFAPDSHGLYRARDGERWYAFTQFQPLSARRAFPCFDQPEFKTPFRVTLRVPRALLAVSSAPMVSRVTRGEERIFDFAETEPIPTYLLALAVGEFDVVDVSRDGRPGPELRILTPAGRGRLARFAAGRTPPILDWLSDWFGQPLPFAKLDQLAVPEFAFGAMENVGLVTYRESRLLVDPAHATLRDRMWSEITIAHELSHMWFGNWVTPAWWDDLWLSESFASWMETKVTDALRPELEAGLEAAAHVQYVMYLDSKRDARAVRSPVETGGDVYNAFDGITYGKGSAVLRMVESWIGEAAFREAVRSYLSEHAFGSGGTGELLAALDRQSAQPVSRVVRGFVDRPGTPLVEAELRCDGSGLWPATLTLAQRRYLPAGRTEPGAEPWTVPVCVRWASPGGNGHGASAEAAPRRACFLLEQARQEFRIPAEHCPAWLHPNAGEAGYYRWSLPEPALDALVRERLPSLDVRERLALPGGLRALLEAGEIGVVAYLEGLLALSADPHRRMAEALAPGIQSLARIVEEAEAEDFARFVRRALSPYLERIGLAPRAGEPRDAPLLRARLLPVLADAGRDAAIRERAGQAADDFLAGDASAFDAEELRVLLPVASWQADAAHWERLRAALDASESPALRQTVLSALGSFDDPALAVRSLELVRDGALRPTDWAALSGALRRAALPGVWAWLRRNHDALAARLGPLATARLPALASGFCSLAERDEVEAFFGGTAPVPGRDRNLALALEDVERCALARDAVGAPMKQWLSAQARAVHPRN